MVARVYYLAMCTCVFMVFLPGGWFHEVESQSTGGAAHSRYHLAINYWFHPVDVLTPDGFAHPYSDPFWEEQYAQHIACFDGPVGGTSTSAAKPADKVSPAAVDAASRQQTRKEKKRAKKKLLMQQKKASAK